MFNIVKKEINWREQQLIKYNGKKYLYVDNVYSSKVPMGEVKLHVNPSDPMDVFYRSKASTIIIFIAIALICISTIVGIGR